jgi:RNA polymerase sigma factor (sigma-70 family)
VRTSDVDYAQSGASSTPSKAGGQADGSEPGRREAAAAGEWLNVEGIFRLYQADLVRLALLLVGDRASAEDVVQDVFTRLCTRGRELDQDCTLAYIRSAVVNGCCSVLRRRALARRIAITRAAPWREVQESAEHAAILAEDRRRVLAALAALPRRRREVLVLRFYLGLPVAEVAAMLGISQGSVKSAAARGLAALARRLGGGNNDQHLGPAERRDERRG